MNSEHFPKIPYRARYKVTFERTQQEFKDIIQALLEELDAVYLDESDEPIRFNPFENRYEIEAVLNQGIEFNLKIYWSANTDLPISVTFDLDAIKPIAIDIDQYFGTVSQQFFPSIKLIYNFLDEPKAVRKKSSLSTDIIPNQQWIKYHRTQYRGRWVALRDGQLLAEAKSVNELVKNLDSTQNVLLTLVT